MQYITNALTHAEPDRLHKAMTGLMEDTLHVSVTYRSEVEIRAEIVNGDTTLYAVVLTPERAFCSCKDAQYRQGKVCSQDNPLLLHACKHALALAVWTLQNPVEEEEDASSIHYLRPDNTPWCGREGSHSDWAWGSYPEDKTAWSRPICVTCEAIVHMPKSARDGATNTTPSEAAA